MKQMFDKSEKLISEQSDEIYGVSTSNWEHSSWKYLSFVGDEEVISLLHTECLRLFRFCIMRLKDEREPTKNYAWEEGLTWFKSSAEYRALDRSDGEPMEFEWNIFTGFTTLQLWQQSPRVLVEIERTTRKEIVFYSQISTTRRMGQFRSKWSWPLRWGLQGMSWTGGGGLARVPNLRMCKQLFVRVAHAGGGEGWIDILPWYRLVGVTRTSSETLRRKSGAARKGKWPPRGTGTTVLTYRRSAPSEQARLVKTVNIQVRWAAAHPGQDRWLQSVATHSRLQRATSVLPREEIILEDGSGVAVDWVTSWPCSSARRRLNVQSGQREGRKACCGSLSERCRPWSWTLKRCCRKQMVPVQTDTQSSDPRDHYREECSRAKVVEIVNTLLCRWRDGWNFLARLFLLISTVFIEQSQICVKNVKLAMSEQGDLLWQDSLTDCLCQVWWRQTYLWLQEEDLLL